MSEFKTFGLDKARVLYSAGVGIEVKNDRGSWSKAAGYPLASAPYRLTPEQELTFEQACLLVGLGLEEELQEDSEGEWLGVPSGVLCSRNNYRTRPLPKQTKIIPHTMETAPDRAGVQTTNGVQGDAFKLSTGKVLVIWECGGYSIVNLESAFKAYRMSGTGKPYGQEVEA